MFSALRKLTAGGNKNEVNGKLPTGGQAMHATLQKKFAKGVHYNMKIIIRGDRNVGKTCLFHRLQGKGFIEEYIPTQEIQVASIQWSYKATDDIVKVEVWDVVDKGKKKKPLEGLKLNTLPASLPEEPALDAEFLDVYKGTHGVIMVLDITKQWTFDYVKRELPKVPSTIPVIVLANHRDMGHHRCISEDDVKFFIESINREPSDAQIRFGESSMRNSFGLKLLHKFFNLPFLALQRDSLLKQLETNRQEMALTNEELDLYLETDDASYDKFLDLLTHKRRQAADTLSSAVSSNAVQAPVASDITPSVSKQLPPTQIQVAAPKAEEVKPAVTQLNPSIQTSINSSSNAATKTDSTFTSVEDFVVEGDGDQTLGFLSSVEETPTVTAGMVGQESDSDAEKEGNPMVMGFQDEIDDEDYFQPSQLSHSATQISVSSDSSDEESNTPYPDRTSFVSKVNPTREDINVENDLDEWLNGIGDSSSSNVARSMPTTKKTSEAIPSINRLSLEPKIGKGQSDECEVTSKPSKKTKEKKSKRKSKRSKDGERSSVSPMNENDPSELPRPYDDYEEI